MTTTEHTVLWIDEIYDGENASDRQSRYGAYLRQRAAEFRKYGPLVDDPAEFACESFTTACSPIMSPGYVRTDPRVRFVEWCWDDDGNPAVQVELVAPHPAPVVGVLADGWWQGWETRGWGENQRWYEPLGLPGAFTTLTLRVPVEVAALPDPAYQGRCPDVAAAKAAVWVVCGQVNSRAGAVLAALEEGVRP